ncbi:hypothetical protein KCU98_g1098, partial [Aureobasidium melanogenum]
MSAKRKRSTGSLFTPSAVEAPSPTAIFSSPALLPNFFAQSKGYDPQSSPIAWKQSNPHQAQQDEDRTSQTLHSRTRKRYRDGRPDESQIHGMRPMLQPLALSVRKILTMSVSSSINSTETLPRAKNTSTCCANAITSPD